MTPQSSSNRSDDEIQDLGQTVQAYDARHLLTLEETDDFRPMCVRRICSNRIGPISYWPRRSDSALNVSALFVWDYRKVSCVWLQNKRTRLPWNRCRIIRASSTSVKPAKMLTDRSSGFHSLIEAFCKAFLSFKPSKPGSFGRMRFRCSWRPPRSHPW